MLHLQFISLLAKYLNTASPLLLLEEVAEEEVGELKSEFCS